MNIDDLTLGQVKELNNLFNQSSKSNDGLNSMIGEKVIIRTYSAGVWFGLLSEKSGEEVILNNARRLRRYQTIDGLGVNAVALHGLDHSKSQVCEAVAKQWLVAIEITPCTGKAIESIEGALNVKAS